MMSLGNSKRMIFQSEINFKKGSTRWMRTFASIYPELIVVYASSDKTTSLYVFTPDTCALSTTLSGVIAIETLADSFLLEPISELLLNTWISALQIAGYKVNNSNHILKHLRKMNPAVVDFGLAQSGRGLRGSNNKLKNLVRTSSLPSVVAYKVSNDLNVDENSLQSPKGERKKGVSEGGYYPNDSVIERKQQKQEEVNEESFDKMVSNDDNNNFKGEEMHPESYLVDEDRFNELIETTLGDPDATPKLEKRASVSQMILNLKTKFGSVQNRRKSKRLIRRAARSDNYASRLLWNPNGQWKDKWFVLENGCLCGYSDIGAKPADVIIDVKTSTMTLYGSQDILNRLNLFKLTTKGDMVHIFVAWNETQFEHWVDTLSNNVAKKEEMEAAGHACNLSEGEGESDIVPYERTLSVSERKQVSTSSDNSSGGGTVESRIDCVDSGNDGDESGLESSISSVRGLDHLTPKREITVDRMQHQSVKNNDVICEDKKMYLPLRKDSTTTSSTECGSPTFHEYDVSLTSSTEQRLKSQDDAKKNRRPSLIGKHRWSMLDLSKIADKTKLKHGKTKLSPDEPKTQGKTAHQVLSRSDSGDSRNSRPPTADSLHSPSTYSVDYWEFRKGVVSDDELQRVCLHSEGKQNELDETFREETLLRKRKNSLTLERGHILSAIETLTDSGKRKSEIHCDHAVRRNRLNSLETKLNNIDNEMEHIDIKMKVFPSSENKKSKASKNTKIISRLRLGKGKNVFDIGSSLDSLASSESRSGSLGRQKDVSIESPSFERTGIEELLLTTEKLENSQQMNPRKLADDDRHRSKSLGSVDQILKVRKSEKHKSTEEAQLVIEDFEQFSQRLVRKMSEATSARIIHV